MELNQAKQLLSLNLPSAETRPQPATDWRGPFALPETVLAYYREVGPVDLEIEAYGNPCYIPSLAQLWQLQAGYRYHPETGERFSDWSDDWLVVAYEGGDPYILDLQSGAILHACHGQGAWFPELLFAGLGEMTAVFATLGAIVLRAGDDLTGDDGEIKPRHVSEAASALETLLSSRGAAEATLRSLGWQ